MKRREFIGKVAKATGLIAAGAAVLRPKADGTPDEKFWDDFGQQVYTSENMMEPLKPYVEIHLLDGRVLRRPNAAWICRKR